jgi:hypothetical protein
MAKSLGTSWVKELPDRRNPEKFAQNVDVAVLTINT